MSDPLGTFYRDFTCANQSLRINLFPLVTVIWFESVDFGLNGFWRIQDFSSAFLYSLKLLLEQIDEAYQVLKQGKALRLVQTGEGKL